MGTIGDLLTSIGAGLVPALAESLGTDTFFVLRASKADNGSGGTTKTWNPTTAEALPALAFTVKNAAGDEQLERIAAERKVAVVFRRLVCAPSVDCTARDRLRVVARGQQPALDNLEIVRSVLLSGAAREIVTVEEQRAA